ncbi:MAG: NAD(P)H-hydrate dehydratase, partial [Caldimicrobium sp.]
QTVYTKVLILCGPGNNGGDGFVCARYLWDRGYKVEVIFFGEKDKYSPEARTNFELLQKINIFPRQLKTYEEIKDLLEHYKPQILVDALFGTGLKKPLTGIFEDVTLLVNEYRKKDSSKIVAIDMPSGISADTGQILGVGIKADYTITFECLKAGLLFYPGKEFAGEVKVVEIGYPWQLLKEKGIIPKRYYLNDRVAKNLYQPRKGFYHKGKTGHLLVLAGSKGKSGAAYLTALGALRAGVGLVTLASPQSLQSIYCSMLPEALTIGLPENKGEISEEAIPYLLEALSQKKAIVIGPGLGLGNGPEKVLYTLLEKISIPIVIDADGLTLITKNLDLLKNYPHPKVITPHPGEAARILSCKPSDILKDPLSAIRELIVQTSAIVVLKGPHTIIASPDGEIYISSIDEPGMAQGGMGDVLSGIIGALIAQGYSPLHACALGVYLHGASGVNLKNTYGPFGFLASHLANHIPVILKKLEEV